MKLSALFDKANIDYPRELGNIEITEIITDSRKVSRGCLFICISGERADGHDYIDEVLNAGAGVIVAEKVRDVGEGGAAAIICVENTRRAASLLYNAWYGDPCKDMRLIGVTGTNGKTSVTNIIKRILEKDEKTCGLIGTLGCFVGDKKLESRSDNKTANMTTPDPSELYRILSEMKSLGAEYVVMEVSSHALALSKVDALRFEIAVFTNLTQDHLDFHGNMQSYLEAKARLFRMCERAVINFDDKNAERIIEKSRCDKIYGVSEKRELDAYAKDVTYRGLLGLEYTFVMSGGEQRLTTALSGRFALINTLEAVATSKLLGVSDASVCEALSELCGIDGRMERLELESGADITVLIDYAHTPDALEKLLRSVCDVREANQRIVLVFGCGGERDRDKRKAMGQIATKFADFVIVTSDNSRGEPTSSIIRDILKGINKEKEYAVIANRSAAIEYAVCNSRVRDIIILAGKGHERYEIDAAGKHYFDERAVVKEAYRKLIDYNV